MERINELLDSCFTHPGKFQFRNLWKLTKFVTKQGRVLYPDAIHPSFGSFILTYGFNDDEDKEVADLIHDSDFQFQEVTNSIC
jgi:hypothetical protein